MSGWKNEGKAFSTILVVFGLLYFLPENWARLENALVESVYLAQWYAREHVILCLVPAFFISGAIGVFVSSAAVMKYLGARTNKFLAYGVASVSGSVLAVCSCTVLPLFAGIYRMGAGLGPAIAFLYAGPAINVLAIILTARVLGLPLGIARAVAAILFSIVIGLIMHMLFQKRDGSGTDSRDVVPEAVTSRPLWQTVVYFAVMVGILIFGTWGKPAEVAGFWSTVYAVKWPLTGGLGLVLGGLLIAWFGVRWWKIAALAVIVAFPAVLMPDRPLIAYVTAVGGLSLLAGTSGAEMRDWLDQSWGFAKQIMPLLFFGVLVAGLFFGRPGQEGLIPSGWVTMAVGGNSLTANLFASVVGAFMYFATLTEVPILQGLLDNGMGQGPALALLLAGPALSLPNMLVIRSVIGTKKTIVFVLLVVVMATISGVIFGALIGAA